MAKLDVSSLAALVEALSAPSVLCDRHATIVAANRAALTVLSDLRLGPELPWQLGDVSADALLAQVLGGGDDEAVDTLLEPPPARTVRAARVDAGDGTEPLALLQIFEPTTDAGERTARDRLTARMLPGLTHELRGPLTTVSGVAQVLAMNEDLSEDLRSQLELAHSQIYRADNLLSSAAAFARGTYAVEPLPVSLNDAVERALTLLAYDLRRRRLLPSLTLDRDTPLLPIDAEDLVALVLDAVCGLLDELQPLERIAVATRCLPGRRAELTVTVEDSERVALSEAPVGHLVEAERRAARLGGELDVRQLDGGGFQLRVRVRGFTDLGGPFLRPPQVLLADRNLRRLLRSARAVAPLVAAVQLASCAPVADRRLALRRPEVAAVDAAIAGELERVSERARLVVVCSGPEDAEAAARTAESLAVEHVLWAGLADRLDEVLRPAAVDAVRPAPLPAPVTRRPRLRPSSASRG